MQYGLSKGIDHRAFPLDMPLDERFAVARDVGFDGLELAIGGKEGLPLDISDADCERLRRLGETHTPICSVNGGRALLERPLTGGSAEDRQAAMAMAARLIDLTAALGTDTLLFVPGLVQPDSPYDDTWDCALRCTRELAEYAAERGVHLAVENVWNRFLLSPMEMASFIDSVGHPSVHSYFDIANTLLFGYPQHWIKVLGRRIWRVHVKDFRVSVASLGGFTQPLQGDVDWPVVVSALHRSGYRGFLTAEVPCYRYCGVQTVRDASAALDAVIGLLGA